MTTPPLLPDGVPIAFDELDGTLGAWREERRRGASPALTATVVVIGPHPRLVEAASALDRLAGEVGIRSILISVGDHSEPSALVSEHAIALAGLRLDFVNNAVAALRLSSLPTLVWWRGGALEGLDDLPDLCDRLVLDAEDPVPAWTRVPALAERTAVSDLRWTRLTRWRALMAGFFDIPDVRAAAPAFTRLQIDGADRHAMRLYAGWLHASLGLRDVALDLRQTPGGAAVQAIRFGNDAEELTLRLAPSGTCVQTAARVAGHAAATRFVALGNQDLTTLVAEELRVRSRDLAFEKALGEQFAMQNND